MKRIGLFVLGVLVFGACSQSGSKALADLKEGFNNPPQEARTLVWWHWMNGNITKDGIRKDLEWMDRIGLGGVQHFDAALGTPVIVDNRLVYMDEGWKDAFAYAAKVSDSLHLEMAVASAPGWSSTGGPWVEPKDGMKKLVWRTLTVNGGASGIQLPEPFKTTGAFQNGEATGRGSAAVGKQYYEDIAVLAVKIPESHKTMEEMGARVSSSLGQFTLAQLTDSDVTDGSVIPFAQGGGNAWLMYEFPETQTIRSVSIVASSSSELEASDDGVSFSKICELRGGRTAQSTLSIPETTAKYFRLVFRRAPQRQFNIMGFGSPSMPKDVRVDEFELFPYTRVNRAEDKAGFSAASHLSSSPTPSSTEDFPTVEDVVDITSTMDASGRLAWTAPEGKWKIYRFGYSLTGKQNHPAPLEATGLEVDKLDPIAWHKYFRTYLDMYKEASDGLLGSRGVQYVLTDSYEAEHENWTPAMFEEFKTRRGYDLRPWLPVLAGEVIGSAEQSDAFLWDWRQNLGDLISANYDQLTKISQDEYGMLGRYTESHEGGRAYVGDGMDLKRTAQVPMSAMWVDASWLGRDANGEPNRNSYKADDRESASVAHIYGQNVAAAESMTVMGVGPVAYSYTPENLKAIADIEFANGINRIVIHESAHQPVDDKVPGLSLGGVGQWFNRHETWAEMADVWAKYMSRSCFMLQAGKNVADVLYYYGEDNNVGTEFGGRPPQVPSGYEWDYCSPDALLNQISAKGGKLVAGSGAEYKVLWMDRNMDYVSVLVLRKIAQLAKAGVYIGGSKAGKPASLADDKAEFDSLVAEIWGSGRKNVLVDCTLDELLNKAGVAPDVIFNPDMHYLHRSLGDIDIYWINKPSKDYYETLVSFRITGRDVQIWHADNGRMEQASYDQKDGRTEVKLPLVPDDAVFVVFAGKGETSRTIEHSADTKITDIPGPWTLTFQEGRGAGTEPLTMPKLISYTESQDFGVKYFSGVATYTNNFNAGKTEGRVLIDLGCVKNIARVWVNGVYCGTAWKEPFRVDIGSAIKEGENTLKIEVANTWVNRLIGDEQPDCPEKITYTDARVYNATSALLPAGLLGPVSVFEKR